MSEHDGDDDGVRVRYFAAAKAAAGIAEEVRALPKPATIDGLVAELTDANPALGKVLTSCSYLLDEVTARPAAPLTAGSVVDVLPPFAGG